MTGQVTTLRRFISKAGDQCLPFFRYLREGEKAQWTSECQEAFVQLKRYLTTVPILIALEVGDILFLYVGVSDTIVSIFLVRKDKGIQCPVFSCTHSTDCDSSCATYADCRGSSLSPTIGCGGPSSKSYAGCNGSSTTSPSKNPLC